MPDLRALLARLDELAEKATPGPWRHYSGPLRPQFPTRIHAVIKGDIEIIKWGGFDGVDLPKRENAANAKLIVELRNAWPILRAALEDK